MAVIDASVWVSFSKEDDLFHEQAKDIIFSLIANHEGISIPAIAFTEVAGAVKRRWKNKNAAVAKDIAMNAVRKMKEMATEVLTNLDELEPLATEIAAHYGIKGADACYLAVAEITGANLVTFDKEQEKAFEEMCKIR